jgi:membrane protein required for colicin V production
MNALDYAWIAIVALSLALGLFRGVVREIFALAGWVLAIVASLAFAGEVAAWLPATLGSPTVRAVAAFVAIFLVVLIAMSAAGILLGKLFRAAGLGFADRFLGAIFGLARGALIVFLAVLAAAFTTLPREPLWRQSLLTPAVETAVIAAKPWLPARIAERVRYER